MPNFYNCATLAAVGLTIPVLDWRLTIVVGLLETTQPRGWNVSGADRR
jgi:hypothetical protein